MFKKAILSAALALAGTAATAQDIQSLPLLIVVQCYDTQEYVEFIGTNYGQIPTAKGTAFVETVDNDELQVNTGLLVITNNFDEGKYSVNITFKDGYTCLLTAGDNFMPFSAPAE